jgi:hypothetical protein
MAKQTGVFIDDARLHPRDNSGGPGGPNMGGGFGDAGRVVGGEPSQTARDDMMDSDEFTAPPRSKGGY